MKRFVAGLAVLGAALGCQQTAIAPPAKLLGIRDMVKVGQYLIVTSSEHDELRVLNTVVPIEPGVRLYVGAPNPLEPLAITVVARPTMLANDTRWGSSGALPDDIELTGPYVYAASSGTAEISIVGIGTGAPGPDGGITTPLDPALEFVEIKRLLTAAPVTAMAATTESGASQLYYATYDGTQALLSTVTLPAAGTLNAMGQSALQSSISVVFALAAGETIVDLLTLPGKRLAIATKYTAGSGGRAFVYSVSTGMILQALAFPYPVRKLATHGGTDLGFAVGAVYDAGLPTPGATPSSSVLRAGDRIFGVLDEEFCPTNYCGIVAVETQTGLIAVDLAGFEAIAADGGTLTREDRQMLPIHFGDSLVTGLNAQTQGAIEVPAANLPPIAGVFAPELETLSVLGSVTLSTGAIVNFNAGDLMMFDDDDTTTDGLPFVSAYTTTDITGNTIDILSGGPNIDGGILLSDGMARDETVYVIFEGLIAGLTNLPFIDAGLLAVDGGYETRTQNLDIVYANSCLRPDGTPVAPDGGMFDVDGGILAVGTVTGSSPGTVSFMVTGPCAVAPTLSIRASGDKPFIVEGDTSGYMGRGGPTSADGGTNAVDFVGSYYRHPFGYRPGTHQMLMTFLPGTDGLQAEYRWTLTMEDNFNPIIYTLDPTAAGCAVPVSLLGQIIDDPNLQRLFVASPAANGILDIDPSVVVHGVLYAGMVCYR